MALHDIGRFNIKFHFNGKIFDLRVTKFSTCDDVIHMIFHKMGLPVTKVRFYAIFEKTGSMERKINGKTLVYKVWRSWGCENEHFEFHIKTKETKLRIKNNLSRRNAENSIDELFLEEYNRKAQTVGNRSSEDVRKHVSFNLEGEKPKPQSSKQNEQSGKRIVLARYFQNLFSRSNKNQRKRETTQQGEHIMNAENSEFMRKSNECGDTPRKQFQQDKCREIWDKYYKTDSESDTDDSLSDISSDENDDVDLSQNETVTLDTAFLKCSRDSDSDEGIDVTSITSGDLDTAFVDGFQTKMCLNETENDITNVIYKSDTNGSELFEELENSLEMNITNDRLLKELFSKTDREIVTSEDDEMDSFMRSRLDSF